MRQMSYIRYYIWIPMTFNVSYFVQLYYNDKYPLQPDQHYNCKSDHKLLQIG